MSNQYLTRPAHGDVNTLSGGDLEGPFLPRLMPIRPSDKRPYSVSEGGFLWKSLGPSDGAMIERWASRFRSCGWGVRTGLLAGLAQSALTVVDVDDLDLAPDWTHDQDLFPWRVRTPRGGVHLYSWAGEPLRSGPLDYGDVKSTGGLVVGWQSDRSYRAEPGFGEGQLPLLPASVLADLIRTSPPPVAVEPVGTRPDRQQTGPSASGRRRTPSRVSLPVGHRNAGLFDRLLVQVGRDADLRGDTARLTGAARWHNAGLDAPLPDAEVVKIASSVTAYSASWETSTAAYRERQRARGQRSGAARRARTSDRDASIVAMRESGLSVNAIARRVGVSPSTVKRTLRTGELARS